MIAVSPSQAVFIFLTAHAPISAAPADVRLAFWTLLTSVAADLDARFPAAFWQCSVDANGRTGSVRSTAIGPNEPAKETENGTSFRESADSLKLAALSTFVGAGPTWRSSRGQSRAAGAGRCQRPRGLL